MSVCFDIRLAADDEAVGFILPELLIDLTTTVGGQRLAQLIGPARALEMMLEGRMYSPQEAHQMGLVNRLAPGRTSSTKPKNLARDTRTGTGTPSRHRRRSSTRTWSWPLPRAFAVKA
jgi:enoyl-CoA hydratase